MAKKSALSPRAAAPFGLLLLAASGFAQSSSFGAGIENSQWYVSESVFECALIHNVPGYGRAIFRHKAGEQLSFILESDTALMRPGRGSVVVEAPPWRPGAAPRKVGTVEVGEGRRPVAMGSAQAMKIAQGLLDGMMPTVTRESWYDRRPVRVRVSNINFTRQFDSYRLCTASLLPVNYDQIKRSRVPFRSGSTSLSGADRVMLDKIVTYVQADSTIERIFVDGHTDRAGSRIENRALSEERANAVAEYLADQGVPQDLMTVRAHADQYPVSNRPADNRRTTIRLQREGELPDLQQANGYKADFSG
ncbi:OmpA family protein [Marinobacter sp.]|uniref:flagellar protein MotY n=1 Tax=Marinobacter sp. TaxID=50741 RepID=UPI0034A5CFC6